MASSDQKGVLGTTVKLNGRNYILWAQAFRLFLGSHNKLVHLLSCPPDSKDEKFSTWQQADYAVMTWLLNSLDESISPNIMFLTTAKEMWDALHAMFSQEHNISRVFELYEKLFSLKQDGQSVTAYFASLKGAADEILLYHPLSCDSQSRKTQWDEFLVAKFLSGLDPPLRSVRDTLLASDTVPTLSNALSRVLRVTTGHSDSPSAPVSDHSALTTNSRGSSRGRRPGGGRGRNADNPKGSRRCDHCGRTNHISEKCWAKFGKPDWANVASTNTAE